jgi:hypothetical protein
MPEKKKKKYRSDLICERAVRRDAVKTTNQIYWSMTFYDPSKYYTLEDEDKNSADWSTMGCSILVPSFFATLTCSKLRMPSRPHRAIMVLS